MSTRLNPYLSFRDTAAAAMEFYRSIFGGELTRTTFAQFGVSDDPAEQDKIMHAMLVTDDGMTLMAADTPNSMQLTAGNTVAVSLFGEDGPQLRGYWDALSDGATVAMPLNEAPWGDSFGMLVDRFGTSWMINITGS